jgi:hypothetical protein
MILRKILKKLNYLRTPFLFFITAGSIKKYVTYDMSYHTNNTFVKCLYKIRA